MYCLFWLVLCIVCLCKCVLYYCHRVATQLQLTNMSTNRKYKGNGEKKQVEERIRIQNLEGRMVFSIFTSIMCFRRQFLYIIFIIIISFMQGIYTYIPETNYVPREYNVTAILLLLFTVLIPLVPVLHLLYFYITTFRSMCAVLNMAVFCSYLTSCLPGMLLTYFLNYFELVPVAPIITGITFVFTFHMRCISVVSSLYFRIFSASFLIIFVF